MQITGRDYETGRPIRLTIEGERISCVEACGADGAPAGLPWLAPALFDLQINGHGGIWFSKQHLTPDEVVRTLEPHFRYGISRLCPTLITASFEELRDGFAAIRGACEQEPFVDKMVPGCHLEGPYIARDDGPRGAHPLAHVRSADWDEFCRLQEAAGGKIRLVTLAPECPGAIDFIRRAVDAGVVIAIGHTAANTDQISAAVDAGARLSTHLGNGAHGVLPRHPNYIWDQLGEPRLMASIISDGFHLPPSVIRTIIRTKGVDNTIITCDAAGFAGCPPGVYENGSMKVEILEDGRLVIAGQRQLLAGSGVETDTCVGHAVAVAGITLGEALNMAGRNPARLLRFEEIQLRAGSRADVVCFDYDESQNRMRTRATIAAGALMYGSIRD